MMEYKRLTKLSDLGTLHAFDFNGEEQPLCELTTLDTDVLIGRLYELENKIESGELGDVKEAEHRAEKVERALNCLARSFAEAMCKYGDDTHYLVDGFIQDAYRQAEKELAEEGER